MANTSEAENRLKIGTVGIRSIIKATKKSMTNRDSEIRLI